MNEVLKRLQQTGVLLLLLFCISSCTFLRTVFHSFPNTSDRKIFASYPLYPAFEYVQWDCDEEECVLLTDTSYRFMIDPEEADIFLEIQKSGEITNLDDFLRSKKTTAFLIVEDGRIVFERYYREHGVSSRMQLFSVSKSFVAAMVGLGMEDGAIQSIYDPLFRYLPEIDSSLREIRLVDMLDMRTGVDDSFTLTAELYYGNDLRKIVEKGKLRSPVGLNFHYSNWATQQLMFVLEAATQKPFGEYFEEKLWNPLGMEYPGEWSVDSKRSGNIRAFTGLTISARDLAKFGMLYLDDGMYAGKQIIPASWIEETMTLHHQDIEQFSMTSTDYPYNMHWRIIEDQKVICAVGMLGQFLYIDKPQNRIIIRLGNFDGNVDWIAFFKSMQVVRR